MEKEQRPSMRAACGHRVYKGEPITEVASEWDDVPPTQCEPCFERWQEIIGKRIARLTPQEFDQIFGVKP